MTTDGVELFAQHSRTQTADTVAFAARARFVLRCPLIFYTYSDNDNDRLPFKGAVRMGEWGAYGYFVNICPQSVYAAACPADGAGPLQGVSLYLTSRPYPATLLSLCLLCPVGNSGNLGLAIRCIRCRRTPPGHRML